MKPAPYAFLALFLWLILATAASLRPFLIVYWQLAGMILLGLALIDAWRVWRLPGMKVQRQVSGSLPLGVWN